MVSVNPQVSPTDTLAGHFRKIAQRLGSLERASGGSGGGSGGGGSGGGNPAGTIITGVWPTAPTGYTFLDGQTLTDAQTAHPELWDAVPASWKSGANIVLPDMDADERVLSSGASVGNLAGANVATIGTANLPAHAHPVSITSAVNNVDHTHTINHQHAAGTSGNPSANHTHSINHDHPATPSGGAHTHTGRYLTTATGSGGNADLLRPGTSTYTFTAVINAGGTADGAHTHDLASFAGNSGTVSAWHTHDTTIPAFNGASGGNSADHTHTVTGNTGNAGSGTALNTQTARLYVRYAIKL